MFIIFNNNLYNANMIFMLERKVNQDKTQFIIELTLANGQTVVEKLKSESQMNARFSALAEHVGASMNGGIGGSC